MTPTRQWQRRYALRLVLTDFVGLVWGVFGATLVLFDVRGTELNVPVGGAVHQVPYLLIAVLVVVLWMLVLAVIGSRRFRILGTGAAEYRTVVQSAFIVLVAMGLTAFALRSELSRWFTFVAVAAGLVALLVSRALWRWWLRARRAAGMYCQRVLIVGSEATAEALAADLQRNLQAGYLIVGACVRGGEPGTVLGSTTVPIVGGIDAVQAGLLVVDADTVLVTGGHNLLPSEVRELSWSLEPGRQHLIVAPSLTDVAGPRIHTRPVAGLPLIHVETPRFEGANRYLKRGFDVVGSLTLLALLSPLLITVAIIIKVTSPGPIFFSHERIGKNGAPFRMLKFRSMVPNADAMLHTLLEAQNTADKPLFKIENDPRITPIGRFIRRYSIDEIPQLINVLRGDMSLVGPRPQVAREVALYDSAAARRLFVQPGMTGLWQVSGRSNLDWEESVRLDLYYVENWSMTQDLSILWRTLRAVLLSDGAV